MSQLLLHHQDQRSTKDPARPDLGGDRPIDMASDEASKRESGSGWWTPGMGAFPAHQVDRKQQSNIGRYRWSRQKMVKVY